MTELTRQELWRSLRALTLLDMIVTPEGEEHLRMMDAYCKEGLNHFVLDNGGGDRLWVCLTDNAIVIKGFDHESSLNQFAAEQWDEGFFGRLFEGMPEELKALFDEEQLDETTFCMWQTEGVWHQNYMHEDGGEAYLMSYIFSTAEKLRAWAEDYYGRKLDEQIIKKLFDKGMLTEDEMKVLAPECEPRRIMAEFFSRTVSGR